MKLKLTITGYYDLPDDPAHLMRAYGTTDVAACCDLDRENAETDPAMLVEGLGDVTIEIVPAADGTVASQCECGGRASHVKGCRWRQGYGSHVITEGN